MGENYAKAYTEVLEIISYFNEEEYSKIPKEEIDFFEKHKDKNYNYKINPEIDLLEQNISSKANAILIVLFRDYFANENQKKVLNRLLKQNQAKEEEEKRNRYNPDKIFEIKEKATIENESFEKKNSLLSIKKHFSKNL